MSLHRVLAAVRLYELPVLFWDGTEEEPIVMQSLRTFERSTSATQGGISTPASSRRAIPVRVEREKLSGYDRPVYTQGSEALQAATIDAPSEMIQLKDIEDAHESSLPRASERMVETESALTMEERFYVEPIEGAEAREEMR